MTAAVVGLLNIDVSARLRGALVVNRGSKVRHNRAVAVPPGTVISAPIEYDWRPSVFHFQALIARIVDSKRLGDIRIGSLAHFE